VLRFPRLESGGETLPDFASFKERFDTVAALERDRGAARIIVAEADALIQHLPPFERLAESVIDLAVGREYPLERLSGALSEKGYDRVLQVEFPCEYSLRGGILDLYLPTEENPLRIEFDGDNIASLRRFSVETQTTIEPLESVKGFLPPRNEVGRTQADSGSVPLTFFMPDGSVVVLAGAEAVLRRMKDISKSADPAPLPGSAGVFEKFEKEIARLVRLECESLPVAESGGANLDVSPVERIGGGASRVVEEVKRILGGEGSRIVLFAPREAERERLLEIFRAADVPLERIEILLGALSQGMAVGRPRTYILSTDELFNRYRMRRQVRPSRYRRAIESFLELKPGDYVVHMSHGIGRFHGINRMARRGREEDYLIIEYAEQQLLYVPATNIGLVQKYIGGRETAPRLAKVGGALWQRQKERIKEALVDLATELLEIQAMRESRPGIRYGEDTQWQREFEAAFPYDDTPDQEFATDDIKKDMESPRPSDRLLCGDVGYGKTEIAMRAAFKAVNAGKQVAILVPTTILAQQHYATFTERMAEFPIIVDVISRFRSAKDQREIVQKAGEGKVDILIGTHRLISEDVRFKDLGLLIIDEEQRFGVTHKERLKRMRAEVDILTLTATPIPRTLHMSLLGIKDISTLETPPLDRRSIVTEIHRWDPELIRNAILRELDRSGQVYFVHNRVYNIEQVRRELEKICPEARYTVGHGQMDESLLEERMLDFIKGKHDVLVSTTIIESGLDIPNVNTIIINRAEMFGLADLHQLRGRVGRYKYQAYAYLLLPRAGAIPDAAEKRLRAIEEFNELGAGFKIAMRDLEIRGAGNILGKEQSGHIATVGYDLYCKLLEGSVREVKDQEAVEEIACEVDVHPKSYLPDDYMGGVKPKLEIYRRATACGDEAALDGLIEEVRDRFGAPPRVALRFFDKHRLRIRAGKAKIFYLGIQGKTLIVKFRDLSLAGSAFGRLQSKLRLIAPDTVYYDMPIVPESPEDALSVLLHLIRKIPDASTSLKTQGIRN
jgi:transcription-repair coupling factor (superfamily II helicase)